MKYLQPKRFLSLFKQKLPAKSRKSREKGQGVDDRTQLALLQSANITPPQEKEGGKRMSVKKKSGVKGVKHPEMASSRPEFAHRGEEGTKRGENQDRTPTESPR